MTTIEKIERGIITLAEFTEDQQSFIRGIVKLSFNEGQEQALRIHDVVGQSEQLVCDCGDSNMTWYGNDDDKQWFCFNCKKQAN